MKKVYSLPISLLLAGITANAQNISVNTTGAANTTSSLFEVIQPAAAAGGTTGIFARHLGTTSPAYAIWAEATGAANKYALVVPSGGGRVGIGTTAPGYLLETAGDIYANGGWMRVSGNQGLYFESWGGGWYMVDGTWIRSYNSKNVYIDQFLRADGGIASGGLGSPGAGAITATNFINSNTGFRVSSAAASGTFLRGNGTNYVGSGILAADLPPGSGNYIQNQFAGAQAANHWVSGSSRALQVYAGDWFRNDASGTGLYNQVNGRHFYSDGAAYWSLTTGNGMIFRDSYGGTVQGYVYNDGTNFGLLHRGGGWGIGTSTTRAFVNQPLMVNGSGAPSYALHTLGDIYANGGWLRVSGNQGLYYESWGGGFYMSDADWIRTYAPSDITGIDVNGPITVGGWNAPRRAMVGWYIGGDPLIAPTTDYWGYVGAYANPNWTAWYEMNAYDYWNISDRKEKHDIYSINDNDALTALVMEDIDKIKPSFYRYNKEKDFFDGNDSKYKPQMHIGVISDESPDYILGQTYDKVNLYGIATMSLVGVKENRKEIKEIKDLLGINSVEIIVQDFGTTILTGTEVWVSFSNDFSQKTLNSNIPVVTVTSNNPSVQLSVIEKNHNGFKVKTLTPVTNLTFDWVAITKIQTTSSKSQTGTYSSQIPSSLYERLRVPESTKNTMIDFYKTLKLSPKSSATVK